MHTDISYSSEKKENILKMTQEQVIHALQHYAPSHYQMRLIKPTRMITKTDMRTLKM